MQCARWVLRKLQQNQKGSLPSDVEVRYITYDANDVFLEDRHSVCKPCKVTATNNLKSVLKRLFLLCIFLLHSMTGCDNAVM